MRGEHLPEAPYASIEFGSSPHTRGTLEVLPGNGCVSAVHPRTRGEHIQGGHGVARACGSSPHTRGTQKARIATPLASRFIPAHAGNTASSALTWRITPVHPRTRGEHRGTIETCVAVDGSSPHTRGTLGLDHAQRHHGRFIPAHAGNTHAASLLWWRRAVHPRTRGEHNAKSHISRRCSGSSPHTRGTRHVCRPCGRFRPVHPRTRGEHARCVAHADDFGRFIPAHAGNTWSTGTCRPCWSVHPRTRGEHVELAFERLGATGSSPHTRGTLRLGDDVVLGGRFIPAHAGNTLTANP